MLIKDYKVIFEKFKAMSSGLLILRNESEIQKYYKDLIFKIESIESENRELRNDLSILQEKPPEMVFQPIHDRIINTIKGLTVETLEDFEKYRLNPYLKLQESKINH